MSITALNDESLTTTAKGGTTTGSPVTFSLTLADTAPSWGIHKVILYGLEDVTVMSGWQVFVTYTSANEPTTMQSNAANVEVECGEISTAASTGDHRFLCPPNTAGNIVRVSGAADTEDLAELVVAGLSWDTFPCDTGYSSANGTHAADSSLPDCVLCPEGTHAGSRGSTECTACVNDPTKTIYYSKDLSHRQSDKCQVCVDKTVANTATNAECVPCPLGYKLTASWTGDPNWSDAKKIEQCTEFYCESCGPGTKRGVNDPVEESCVICQTNTYAAGGSGECTPCPLHTHSPGNAGSCTTCPSEDDVQKIVTEMSEGPIQEMSKCLEDTGKACVALEPFTNKFGTFAPTYQSMDDDPQVFDCEYDCPNDSPAGCVKKTATFTCVKKDEVLQFEPLYFCQRTSNTESIETIYDEETTIEGKADKFKTVTNNAEENSIGIGDVEATTKLLGNIITLKDNETLEEGVVQDVVEGLSNILTFEMLSDDAESGTEIKKSFLGKVVDFVNSVEEEGKLVTSENIVIIKNPKPKEADKKDSALLFSLPKENSDLSNLKLGTEETEETEIVLAIEVEEAGSSDVDMTVFVVKSDTKMFPNIERNIDPAHMIKNANVEMEGSAKEVVNSLIVEVTVQQKDTSNGVNVNLFFKPETPISSSAAENTHVSEDGTKQQLQYRCKSLDRDTSQWTDEGCDTYYKLDPPGIICQCNHNTSFAVLMSPYPIDPGYLEAQVVMSTVLLSLSVVCLLLSIASLLPVKALMAQRSTKINVCFSFSLLLATFLFLLQNVFVKSDNTGIIKLGSPACIAYAIFQHYIWLVVFMWMMVEGVLMYLSLVLVFGSHISKYMLKFNLICWGVPILFPIVGHFAFTKTVSVGEFTVTSTSYLAETMCFLKPGGPPFWGLFFAPLMVGILVNTGFFLLVLRVIRSSKSVQITDRELLVRQMKAALGVMILLGTGWIVGVFMTIPEPNMQIALQYLFILLNASQGIGVFVFYILLNDQVRLHWLTMIGMQEKAVTSANSSSTRVKTTTATKESKVSNTENTENIYANDAKPDQDEDHTYDTAFPATSEENGNI